MSGASIVVAGAGAVGCATAYVLARAGHRVTVVDPAAIGANASGVAAGMLAPAFETLFDAETGADFALLAASRDLWPALAAEIGLPLARDGALAIGSRAEATGWVEVLACAGAKARLLTPEKVTELTLGQSAGAWAAFTPDDWRLAPKAALAQLQLAAERCGARFVAQAQAEGATDFRVNQQQVDAAGNRVGINRPDLQYTDENMNSVYVEYDTPSSTRGPDHQARILANDPNATVILKTVK